MSRYLKRIGVKGAFLGVVMLACVGVATPVSSAPGNSGRLSKGGYRFPLWKLLPSSHYAVLGSGVGSETEWSAFTYRPMGVQRAGAQPCIAVVGVSPEGNFPNDTSCGPVVPSVSRVSEPPRYVLYGRSHVERGDKKVIGETVLAIVFSPEIVKAKVKMEDTIYGKPLYREIATRRLSSAQSAKANVKSFRYVAFNVAANICLDSVAGFDSAGSLRFDLGEEECPVG
jgi:hypothetical protein